MDPCWTELAALEVPLRRFLQTRCRDDGEIDDIIQETYLRAARFRASLRIPEKLRPWAFRIAGNILLDRVRKEARLHKCREMDYPLDSVPAPESLACEALIRVGELSVDSEEAVDMLDKALGDLGVADRELVEHHYLGKPTDQILPDAVIKVRLYRARRRIGRAMSAALRRQRLLEAHGALCS